MISETYPLWEDRQGNGGTAYFGHINTLIILFYRINAGFKCLYRTLSRPQKDKNGRADPQRHC